MRLRLLALFALALLTLAVVGEAFAYGLGLLTRDLAFALLGLGVALTCLPLIAALKQERRLERGPS